MIIGNIRDIQPNGPESRLELYFSNADIEHLPKGDKARIVLVINGVSWSGTIRTTAPGNPPYVHTKLSSAINDSTCTKVFLDLGLAEGARLAFEVPRVGELRLSEILDRGRWRTSRGRSRSETSSGGSHQLKIEPSANSPAVLVEHRSFPFENPQAVRRLSEEYWGLISPSDAAEERAFEIEMPTSRKVGFLTKEMFVRLARWKSKRKTPDYMSNASDVVETATRAAFRAHDDAEAVGALTALNGVALRTATALLHWMKPDRFPILDFRVVEALGAQEPKNWENAAFYGAVAERVRSIASLHQLDLRTIDRALWAWSKKGGRLPS